MLTALRIGNFKAFAEPQTVPIKPLTLIFGANSAGKSSIIHALVFARHALDTGELDTHRTAVGGEAIDLGGFRQYIHRRDAARRMEWSAEIDVAALHGQLAQILAPVRRATVTATVGVEVDDKGTPRAGCVPAIHAYEIAADGESIVRMSRRRDGRLQLDRLAHDHPVLRQVVRAIVETATTVEAVRPADFEGLNEAIARLTPEVVTSGEHFLPQGLSRPLLRERPGRERTAASQAGQPVLFPAPGASETTAADAPTLFPISRGQRTEDLAAALRFFLPRTLDELIGGLTRAVTQELARVRYLGPLRSYPPRHLAFSQHHDPNWIAGGGYAWDVVRREGRVRAAVNDWLSNPERLKTPYEVAVRGFVALDQLESQLAEGIGAVEPIGVDIVEAASSSFITAVENAVLSAAKKVVGADTQLEAVYNPHLGEVEVFKVLTVVDTVTNSGTEISLEDARAHLDPEATVGDDILEKLDEGYGRIGPLVKDAEQEARRLCSRIAESDVDRLQELALIDIRSGTPVSHRDVGIGISQVLPVLVAAYGAEHEIWAIEQPEIHLHPALQAELADVFIESALGERRNTFLLETHSEHLILRVMRRMRDTVRGKRAAAPPVTPDDVAVLFVEPTPKGSVVYQLRLKPDGSLLDPWPGGFFEEGFSELFG